MTDLPAQLQRALGASYIIERELGGGGMSRVFLAEETRFGRRVVVKLLSPELGPALLSNDDDAIEAAIRLNIEAGTGPTTLAVWVDRELEALLPHPRLGPLVRQLSLYAPRNRK